MQHLLRFLRRGPISPHVHGMSDYLLAATLIAVPLAVDFHDDTATVLMLVLERRRNAAGDRHELVDRHHSNPAAGPARRRGYRRDRRPDRRTVRARLHRPHCRDRALRRDRCRRIGHNAAHPLRVRSDAGRAQRCATARRLSSSPIGFTASAVGRRRPDATASAWCAPPRRHEVLLDPAADDVDGVRLLVGRELAALRNAVPALQAAAAAGRRRVLGDEHRMAAVRRLLAVLVRRRRREPLGQQLPRRARGRRPCRAARRSPRRGRAGGSGPGTAGGRGPAAWSRSMPARASASTVGAAWGSRLARRPGLVRAGRASYLAQHDHPSAVRTPGGQDRPRAGGRELPAQRAGHRRHGGRHAPVVRAALRPVDVRHLRRVPW